MCRIFPLKRVSCSQPCGVCVMDFHEQPGGRSSRCALHARSHLHAATSCLLHAAAVVCLWVIKSLHAGPAGAPHWGNLQTHTSMSLQAQLQVPVEVLQNNCSEMECALEAANALVDVLDHASTQLDALTKAGHKRCGH